MYDLVILSIVLSCPCNHRMVLSFWPLYDLILLTIVFSCHFDHCIFLSFWPLHGLVLLSIVWSYPFVHCMILSFWPLYGLVLLTIVLCCLFDLCIVCPFDIRFRITPVGVFKIFFFLVYYIPILDDLSRYLLSCQVATKPVYKQQGCTHSVLY